MTEKVTGYILLVLGLFIIIFTLMNMYMVATGRSEPFQIFNFDSISLDMNQLSQGSIELPAELEEAGIKVTKPSTPSVQEILPSAILNQSSNYFIHIVILGFIASVGYKIAHLGVQLIRPIIVKTSERKLESAGVLVPPTKL